MSGDRLLRLAETVELAALLDGPRSRFGWARMVFGDGRYRGERLRGWIAEQLDDLGVETFADLRLPGADKSDVRLRYRLIVTVTDVTNGRLGYLPWDYEFYGHDPDEQRVADAVRASASMPYLFQPSSIVASHSETNRSAAPPPAGTRCLLVDGGVLSNFPLAVLDDQDAVDPGGERVDRIGVQILPSFPLAEGSRLFPTPRTFGLRGLRMAELLVGTMIAGRDQRRVGDPASNEQIIRVDTGPASMLDFSFRDQRRTELVESGRRAAATFIERHRSTTPVAT
jgi:NTE family protein